MDASDEHKVPLVLERPNHEAVSGNAIDGDDDYDMVADLYGFLVIPRLVTTNPQRHKHCLGTLIHADAILTSAHCIEDGYFAVGTTMEFVAHKDGNIYNGRGEIGVVRHVSRIPAAFSHKPAFNDDGTEYLHEPLAVVFLQTQSSAPSAILSWNEMNSHYLPLRGTSFAVSQGVITSIAVTDISLDGSSTFQNRTMFCHETTSAIATAGTVAVGAPVLGNDNSVLGVMSGRRCCPKSELPWKDTDDRYGLSSDYEVTMLEKHYVTSIQDAICAWSRALPSGQQCFRPELANSATKATATTDHRLLSDSTTTTRNDRRRLASFRVVERIKKILRCKNKDKQPNVAAPQAPTAAAPKAPTAAAPKAPTPSPSVPKHKRPVVSAFPSFEPTSFTIPPTIAPPMKPSPVMTLPVGSPPVTAPKAAAPVGVVLTCVAPPPPLSSKCPGRNLMQKQCLTQCVAEENVRRKRKAGWRCGQCS